MNDLDDICGGAGDPDSMTLDQLRASCQDADTTSASMLEPSDSRSASQRRRNAWPWLGK